MYLGEFARNKRRSIRTRDLLEITQERTQSVRRLIEDEDLFFLSQALEALLPPASPWGQEPLEMEGAPRKPRHRKRRDQRRGTRDRRNRDPRPVRRIDEPLARITHEWGSGIGDQGQVLARDQRGHELRHTGGFIVGVTGHERNMDVEMGEEFAGVACVLGHDPVCIG